MSSIYAYMCWFCVDFVLVFLDCPGGYTGQQREMRGGIGRKVETAAENRSRRKKKEEENGARGRRFCGEKGKDCGGCTAGKRKIVINMAYHGYFFMIL